MKTLAQLLMILLMALFLTGCVSFKPVVIDSFNDFSNTSGCTNPATDICKARNYALDVSQKYKKSVIDNYEDNNSYDSWVLNLVTLGVGAEIASLHSDVVKTVSIGLGHQAARKTYQNIPFQLQVYTNAITASQCVYDNSTRLQKGYSELDKIRTIISTLNQSLSIMDSNVLLTNQLITTDLKELGDYASIRSKLARALELAKQSYNSLETAGDLVVKSIQKIDITILKRFNGQLPDINELSSQLKQQIIDNIELEENGGVDELPDSQANALTFLLPPAYAFLKEPLAASLNAMNELSHMRVERYISDANLIEACPASI